MSFPVEFFGEDLIADVNDLVDIWGDTETRLRLLMRDPELLGAANINVAVRRAQDLLREVAAELQVLRDRTTLWIAGSVPNHVTQGTASAMISAGQQGATGAASGGLGVANTQAIGLIADDILSDLEFSINSTQRTIRRTFRATQQTLLTEAAINQSLLISEARLENSNQRSRRLKNLFEKNAIDGKFINVNGRFFRLSTYADIIAKTRLAEAVIEGAVQTTLALGIDTVRVSDHGPTDKFCDPFAGKVFSISGRDPRFPRLRRRPPFHPNCIHFLTPFIPGAQDPEELNETVRRSNEVILTEEEFDRAGA